jgi:hypothetical protein
MAQKKLYFSPEKNRSKAKANLLFLLSPQSPLESEKAREERNHFIPLFRVSTFEGVKNIQTKKKGEQQL